MANTPKEILIKFQCEYIMLVEETFAQTLTEHDDVRLFFINENEAFTDGKNIVVDPSIFDIYADEDALIRTSKFLGVSQTLFCTTWNALCMITRSLNIHECLHIIYTDFPCHCVNDALCDTRNKMYVMKEISNIIEDAYIEAVGCSHYDNMEMYLKFMRVVQLFRSKKKETKVINLKDMFSSESNYSISKTEERNNIQKLQEYIGVMIDFLLYPWVFSDNYSKDIKEYVEKTKQYFWDGSIAESPEKRYEYCQKIFKVIEELIPEDEEKISFDDSNKLLIGVKTHQDECGIAGETENKGKTQEVSRRLFSGLEGEKLNDHIEENQMIKILNTMSKSENSVSEIQKSEKVCIVIPANDTGATPVHKNIKINEVHPKINSNLRKAYKNIFTKYASSIRSYNSRFEQLLQAHVTTREEGYTFGSGIVSRRLGDPNKRFWYRQQNGIDVPDMAVMLLIDGSGSMKGKRINAAIESAVILHEVLKNHGINHAVVEHRANFDEPSIDINILLDFDGKDDQKLNLLQMKACGDNRDGLALCWAEKYIGRMTQNDYKLIIVISDGIPAHEYDQYYPPVSVKDTANVVKKIKKRGTEIIGISLDEEEEFDCYDMLSEIYPDLIACNDLARLTGQLLGIITKLL